MKNSLNNKVHVRDSEFNNFLLKFEKPIKNSLYQTNNQDREDLEQELMLKIFIKLQDLSFKEETPDFWGFFEKKT